VPSQDDDAEARKLCAVCKVEKAVAKVTMASGCVCVCVCVVILYEQRSKLMCVCVCVLCTVRW
jgi:hypothetical protein